MKKMKIRVLSLMLFLSVVMMTGCRNQNNGNSTQPSAGTSPMQESTSSVEENTSDTAGESGTWSEESTGVLDDLMNDVERGADDLLDGTGNTNSVGADEAAR